MNDEQRKQMGLDCIEIISKKLSKQITPEQFCDALIGLHQKYPIKGHEPPLTTFQLKNYKRIKQVYSDPRTGVKYWDCLQPWNFNEAAQMYYWHSRADYGKESEGVELDLKTQIPLDFKMRSAGEREIGEEG